jgi:hypothetical protein
MADFQSKAFPPAVQADSQWATADELAAARERNFQLIRRKRLVLRIWRLGPRPTYELLQQLEQYGTDDLDDRLNDFADLDGIPPERFRALGADRLCFPPPLRLVPQE